MQNINLYITSELFTRLLNKKIGCSRVKIMRSEHFNMRSEITNVIKFTIIRQIVCELGKRTKEYVHRQLKLHKLLLNFIKSVNVFSSYKLIGDTYPNYLNLLKI
jgi:hypothetical protein